MGIKSMLFVGLSLVGLAAWGSNRPEHRMSYELFATLYERINQGATVKDLESEIPRLGRNLKIARKVSAAHWTNSTPFDELAKSYILPEKVLDTLGIAHVMTDGVMHVPAGMMHTYGYLFSQLKTAYGLKGKRWIESRVDERLGLEAGTFSPFARKGEFLTNLTRELTRIVEKPGDNYTGRVVEKITWRLPDNSQKTAVVTTHLVDLKPLKDLETTDVKLLIYDVFADGARRFVTAFPVDQKMAESLVAAKPAIGNEFKPRFNLYVDPAWKVESYESEGFASWSH